jgi:hypothetical protein
MREASNTALMVFWAIAAGLRIMVYIEVGWEEEHMHTLPGPSSSSDEVSVV